MANRILFAIMLLMIFYLEIARVRERIRFDKERKRIVDIMAAKNYPEYSTDNKKPHDYLGPIHNSAKRGG